MSTASSPELVILVYACHICEEIKSEGRNLRSHLLTLHSVDLPKLKRGHRHQNTLKYFFIKPNNNETHQAIKQRFACPSCLNHFATIDEFKVHVMTHIDTEKVEPVALPQKRKNGALYKFSKTIEPQNRANFPQEYVTKLEPMVIIEQNEANETNLSALQQFALVEQLLREALKQNVDSLPFFLWGTKNVANSNDEQKLINVIKFALTSFADTCSTSVIQSRPYKGYERTFWVQHVIPIFQTFGNQTGLLSFNWCEIPTMHYSSNDQEATRYVDGMGYDSRKNPRVVFEASSGQHYVKTDKIIDDGTKQISSMMSMLKDIASSHLSAKYDTFLKIKIFGIQSVKTSIILSEMLYTEDGRCIYREVRSAEVPTEYVERNKWVKIFEILCYLFVELKNQEVHYQVIEDEEQGAIIVIPEDTIINKLKSNK